MLPESTGRSPQPPCTGRPRPWCALLESTIVALVGSGVLWLAAKFLFASESPFGRELPAWAPRVLAIHGAAAMLSLVAIGAWLPLHVVPRLRSRDSRVTGFAQLGMFAVLAITGLGLYYFADEAGRPTWSAVHWVSGLLLGAILLAHRTKGRARGAQAVAVPHDGAPGADSQCASRSINRTVNRRRKT